jgi:hypothetical protein
VTNHLPPDETRWPPDFPESVFLGRAAKRLTPDDLWKGLRSGEVKAEVYCVGRTDFAPIAVGAMVFVGADPATVLGQFQIEFRETDHRRSPRVRRGIPVPHWLFVTKTSLVRFAKNSAPSTGGGEHRAMQELAEILRQEPNIRKADAKQRLSRYSLSDQGFEDRIWPRAREAAGLPARATAGRKSRS